jgi:transcriptional regulator with XRE-family HTH domain
VISGITGDIVGKYERDEMTPSIEVAKRVAVFLNTAVGYLLGETPQANSFKDADMLERLNDIVDLPEKEKEALLMSIDDYLRDSKTRKANKNKAPVSRGLNNME